MRFDLSTFGIVTGTPAGNTGTGSQADFNARMNATVDQDGVGNVVADYLCAYGQTATWIALALGVWKNNRTDSGTVYRYTWGMAAIKAVNCAEYGKTAGQLWKAHLDGLLTYWPERLANPDMIEPWYFLWFKVAKAKGLMGDNMTVFSYAQQVAQYAATKGRTWPIPYSYATATGRKLTADSWLESWGGSTDPNADCILAHVKWFFYHFRAKVQLNAADLKHYADSGLNMAGGPNYYEYYIDQPPGTLTIQTRCYDSDDPATRKLVECDHFTEVWPFKFEKGVIDEHYEWVRSSDWYIMDDLWTSDRTKALYVGGEGGSVDRRIKVKDLPWFLINYPFLPLRTNRDEAYAGILPPQISFSSDETKAYLTSWAYGALYSGYKLDSFVAQQLATQAAGVVLSLASLDAMTIIGKVFEFTLGSFVKMVESMTASEPDYSDETAKLHAVWDAQIADIAECAGEGGTWDIDKCIAAVKAELDASAACTAKGWIWDGVKNTCTAPIVGTLPGGAGTQPAGSDSIAGYLLLGIAAFLALKERK
jgi:hypothetical protein